MAWIDFLAGRRPLEGSADYIKQLIRVHGYQKAMEMAVGGNDAVGDRELVVLDHYGLRDGHYLIDVGCGSGRLTRRAAKLPHLRYLGTDVSRKLLKHARATCERADFRFAVATKIAIPEDDGVVDFVAFFSVGTHLMNEEFFVYLEEARRVLRPGGRIVFSFHDPQMPGARKVFDSMVARVRDGGTTWPINVFFTPDTVRLWAQMLGLECVEIADGNKSQWAPSERVTAILGVDISANAFGQSIAVLEKPAPAKAAH